MGKVAEEAIAMVRQQRDETMRAFLSLSEDDCRIRWSGGNVNHELRNFSSHLVDHLQHINKILRHQGRWFTEAELILTEAQALHGKLEGLVLSLSDEEMNQPGPEEGDWSVRQVVEHVASNERMYRTRLLEEMDRARAAAAATS